MNREVSNWMRGLSERDGSPKTSFIATKGYNSVVWNHLYPRDISDLNRHQINQIQSILEETVQVLGAKAMAVGNTPQTTGANCTYNCSVWHIDVGMSSEVLNSQPGVLGIRAMKARVIRSKRDTCSELQTHVLETKMKSLARAIF
ncbi:hypothetical protein ACSBR1_013206 [Camellia fascicularis]